MQEETTMFFKRVLDKSKEETINDLVEDYVRHHSKQV